MTHDEYVKMIKDFLINRAVKTAFSHIVAQLPFLSWGPLAPIINYLLRKVLVVFIDHTELAIFLLYTDIRVGEQGRKLHDAMVKNQEALQNGTEEDKKKAEENLINRFRELVKLTN